MYFKRSSVFKETKFYKECMAHFKTFLPQQKILQFLRVYNSSDIARRKLKIPQITQVNKLSRILELN